MLIFCMGRQASVTAGVAGLSQKYKLVCARGHFPFINIVKMFVLKICINCICVVFFSNFFGSQKLGHEIIIYL